MDETINRINELYHLSKERGLSPEEKDEQTRLRKVCIDSVKANLKSQLDNIEVIEKDGSIHALHKKGE
ncbi:MAG: DUF896 domain-containing protein [Lachnospiraceae bacterium]|nr:DUF896 domain-containing protein [Lachnospiraceae bacterium]